MGTYFLYEPRGFAGPSIASVKLTRSAIDMSVSVIPAAIAGVTRSDLWVRQKL